MVATILFELDVSTIQPVNLNFNGKNFSNFLIHGLLLLSVNLNQLFTKDRLLIIKIPNHFVLPVQISGSHVCNQIPHTNLYVYFVIYSKNGLVTQI